MYTHESQANSKLLFTGLYRQNSAWGVSSILSIKCVEKTKQKNGAQKRPVMITPSTNPAYSMPLSIKQWEESMTSATSLPLKAKFGDRGDSSHPNVFMFQIYSWSVFKRTRTLFLTVHTYFSNCRKQLVQAQSLICSVHVWIIVLHLVSSWKK